MLCIGHRGAKGYEPENTLISIQKALELEAMKVNIFADSELMIKQLKGEYKVKNGNLKVLFIEVTTLLKIFADYNLTHIPREKNKDADKLANKAIDENF